MSFLKTYQKSVASFVTVCFVTSFFILPPPALAQPTLEQIPLSLVPLGIPPELASIDEVFIPDPKKESGIPLIHIQSVHAHAQTQKKIYGLLKLLDEKYGINALYIEGAGEKLNPDYFRFFDDNRLNVRVAEKLVEKGELTGAELFLIESQKKIPAYGLEDPALYRENLTSFEKVMTKRDLTGPFTQETHALLDRLETLLLAPPARKLLRSSEAFDAGQMELLSYALELERMTKEILELDLRYYENQLDWPQMIRLLRLQELESKLEPEKIQSDRQKLTGFLKQIQIDPELVGSFENLSFSPFQSGMVYDPGFRKNDLPRYLAERLVEATLERGFSFDRYPYFTRYLEAAILQSELEAERLFGEMEKLFETLIQRVSSRQEEWKLVGLVHEERLLERLFDLELTPKDYAKVEESNQADRPLVRFLLGIESLYEGTNLGDRKVIPDNIEAIESVYGDAVRFYHLAKEREEVMVEKILTTPSPISSPPPGERIKGEGSITVLITGGFHTEGLSRQFRKKGIPYTIVSPHITEKVSPEAYVSSLLGEKKTVFDTAYMERSIRTTSWQRVRRLQIPRNLRRRVWRNEVKTVAEANIEVGIEKQIPAIILINKLNVSKLADDLGFYLKLSKDDGEVAILLHKDTEQPVLNEVDGKRRPIVIPVGTLTVETRVLSARSVQMKWEEILRRFGLHVEKKRIDGRVEVPARKLSGENGGGVSSTAQRGRQRQLSTRSRRGQVQTDGEETLSFMPRLLSSGERPTIPTQILPRGGKILQVASVRSPSASAPQPAGETVQTLLLVSLSGPNTLAQELNNVNKNLIKGKPPLPALAPARQLAGGRQSFGRAEVRTTILKKMMRGLATGAVLFFSDLIFFNSLRPGLSTARNKPVAAGPPDRLPFEPRLLVPQFVEKRQERVVETKLSDTPDALVDWDLIGVHRGLKDPVIYQKAQDIVTAFFDRKGNPEQASQDLAEFLARPERESDTFFEILKIARDGGLNYEQIERVIDIVLERSPWASNPQTIRYDLLSTLYPDDDPFSRAEVRSALSEGEKFWNIKKITPEHMERLRKVYLEWIELDRQIALHRQQRPQELNKLYKSIKLITSQPQDALAEKISPSQLRVIFFEGDIGIYWTREEAKLSSNEKFEWLKMTLKKLQELLDLSKAEHRDVNEAITQLISKDQYWKRLFELRDKVEQKFQEVKNEEGIEIKPVRYQGLHIQAEGYLSDAEQEFLEEKISDNNLLQVLVRISKDEKGNLFSDYRGTTEDALFDLLQGFGIEEKIIQEIKSLEKKEARKLAILSALKPFILHSDALPASMEIFFRQLIATYIYGSGTKMIGRTLIPYNRYFTRRKMKSDNPSQFYDNLWKAATIGGTFSDRLFRMMQDASDPAWREFAVTRSKRMTPILLTIKGVDSLRADLNFRAAVLALDLKNPSHLEILHGIRFALLSDASPDDYQGLAATGIPRVFDRIVEINEMSELVNDQSLLGKLKGFLELLPGKEEEFQNPEVVRFIRVISTRGVLVLKGSTLKLSPAFEQETIKQIHDLIDQEYISRLAAIASLGFSNRIRSIFEELKLEIPRALLEKLDEADVKAGRKEPPQSLIDQFREWQRQGVTITFDYEGKRIEGIIRLITGEESDVPVIWLKEYTFGFYLSKIENPKPRAEVRTNFNDVSAEELGKALDEALKKLVAKPKARKSLIQRIIEGRPYFSWEDLVRVQGIGHSTAIEIQRLISDKFTLGRDLQDLLSASYPADLQGTKQLIQDILKWWIANEEEKDAKDILSSFLQAIGSATAMSDRDIENEGGILLKQGSYRRGAKFWDLYQLEIDLNLNGIHQRFELAKRLNSVDYFFESLVASLRREAYGAWFMTQLNEDIHFFTREEADTQLGKITNPRPAIILPDERMTRDLLLAQKNITRFAALAISGEYFEEYYHYKSLQWGAEKGYYRKENLDQMRLPRKTRIRFHLLGTQGRPELILEYALRFAFMHGIRDYLKGNLTAWESRSFYHYFLLQWANGNLNSEILNQELLNVLVNYPEELPPAILLKSVQDLLPSVQAISTKMPRSEVRGRAIRFQPKLEPLETRTAPAGNLLTPEAPHVSQPEAELFQIGGLISPQQSASFAQEDLTRLIQEELLKGVELSEIKGLGTGHTDIVGALAREKAYPGITHVFVYSSKGESLLRTKHDAYKPFRSLTIDDTGKIAVVQEGNVYSGLSTYGTLSVYGLGQGNQSFLTRSIPRDGTGVTIQDEPGERLVIEIYPNADWDEPGGTRIVLRASEVGGIQRVSENNRFVPSEVLANAPSPASNPGFRYLKRNTSRDPDWIEKWYDIYKNDGNYQTSIYERKLFRSMAYLSTEWIYGLFDVSPDGQFRVAIYGTVYQTYSSPYIFSQELRIYDLKTGTVRVIPLSDFFESVPTGGTFIADSSTIVRVAYESGDVEYYDIVKGVRVPKPGVPVEPPAVGDAVPILRTESAQFKDVFPIQGEKTHLEIARSMIRPLVEATGGQVENLTLDLDYKGFGLSPRGKFTLRLSDGSVRQIFFIQEEKWNGDYTQLAGFERRFFLITPEPYTLHIGGWQSPLILKINYSVRNETASPISIKEQTGIENTPNASGFPLAYRYLPDPQTREFSLVNLSNQEKDDLWRRRVESIIHPLVDYLGRDAVDLIRNGLKGLSEVEIGQPRIEEDNFPAGTVVKVPVMVRGQIHEITVTVEGLKKDTPGWAFFPWNISFDASLAQQDGSVKTVHASIVYLRGLRYFGTTYYLNNLFLVYPDQSWEDIRPLFHEEKKARLERFMKILVGLEEQTGIKEEIFNRWSSVFEQGRQWASALLPEGQIEIGELSASNLTFNLGSKNIPFDFDTPAYLREARLTIPATVRGQAVHLEVVVDVVTGQLLRVWISKDANTETGMGVIYRIGERRYHFIGTFKGLNEVDRPWNPSLPDNPDLRKLGDKIWTKIEKGQRLFGLTYDIILQAGPGGIFTLVARKADVPEYIVAIVKQALDEAFGQESNLDTDMLERLRRHGLLRMIVTGADYIGGPVPGTEGNIPELHGDIFNPSTLGGTYTLWAGSRFGINAILWIWANPFFSLHAAVHEVVHWFDMIGIPDSRYQRVINAAVDSVIKRRLWRGTYAGTQVAEWFAEVSTSYFDSSAFSLNGVINRARLVEYDRPTVEFLGPLFRRSLTDPAFPTLNPDIRTVKALERLLRAGLKDQDTDPANDVKIEMLPSPSGGSLRGRFRITVPGYTPSIWNYRQEPVLKGPERGDVFIFQNERITIRIFRGFVKESDQLFWRWEITGDKNVNIFNIPSEELRAMTLGEMIRRSSLPQESGPPAKPEPLKKPEQPTQPEEPIQSEPRLRHPEEVQTILILTFPEIGRQTVIRLEPAGQASFQFESTAKPQETPTAPSLIQSMRFSISGGAGGSDSARSGLMVRNPSEITALWRKLIPHLTNGVPLELRRTVTRTAEGHYRIRFRAQGNEIYFVVDPSGRLMEINGENVSGLDIPEQIERFRNQVIQFLNRIGVEVPTEKGGFEGLRKQLLASFALMVGSMKGARRQKERGPIPDSRAEVRSGASSSGSQHPGVSSLLNQLPIEPNLPAMKAAVQQTLDWLLQEGLLQLSIFEVYRDALKEAEESDQVPTIGKGPFHREGVKISINSRGLSQEIAILKAVGSADYFAVNFLLTILREAQSYSFSRWIRTTRWGTEFEKEAAPLLIDGFKSAKTGQWEFNWPSNDLSRFFSQYGNKIADFLAYLISIEHFGGLKQIEGLEEFAKRGLYDPKRRQGVIDQKKRSRDRQQKQLVPYLKASSQQVKETLSNKENPLASLQTRLRSSSVFYLSRWFEDIQKSLRDLTTVTYFFYFFSQFELFSKQGGQKGIRREVFNVIRQRLNQTIEEKDLSTAWFHSAASDLLPKVQTIIDEYHSRAEVRSKEVEDYRPPAASPKTIGTVREILRLVSEKQLEPGPRTEEMIEQWIKDMVRLNPGEIQAEQAEAISLALLTLSMQRKPSERSVFYQEAITHLSQPGPLLRMYLIRYWARFFARYLDQLKDKTYRAQSAVQDQNLLLWFAEAIDPELTEVILGLMQTGSIWPATNWDRASWKERVMMAALFMVLSPFIFMGVFAKRLWGFIKREPPMAEPEVKYAGREINRFLVPHGSFIALNPKQPPTHYEPVLFEIRKTSHLRSITVQGKQAWEMYGYKIQKPKDWESKTLHAGFHVPGSSVIVIDLDKLRRASNDLVVALYPGALPGMKPPQQEGARRESKKALTTHLQMRGILDQFGKADVDRVDDFLSRLYHKAYDPYLQSSPQEGVDQIEAALGETFLHHERYHLLSKFLNLRSHYKPSDEELAANLLELMPQSRLYPTQLYQQIIDSIFRLTIADGAEAKSLGYEDIGRVGSEILDALILASPLISAQKSPAERIHALAEKLSRLNPDNFLTKLTPSLIHQRAQILMRKRFPEVSDLLTEAGQIMVTEPLRQLFVSLKNSTPYAVAPVYPSPRAEVRMDEEIGGMLLEAIDQLKALEKSLMGNAKITLPGGQRYGQIELKLGDFSGEIDPVVRFLEGAESKPKKGSLPLHIRFAEEWLKGDKGPRFSELQVLDSYDNRIGTSVIPGVVMQVLLKAVVIRAKVGNDFQLFPAIKIHESQMSAKFQDIEFPNRASRRHMSRIPRYVINHIATLSDRLGYITLGRSNDGTAGIIIPKGAIGQHYIYPYTGKKPDGTAQWTKTKLEIADEYRGLVKDRSLIAWWLYEGETSERLKKYFGISEIGGIVSRAEVRAKSESEKLADRKLLIQPQIEKLNERLETLRKQRGSDSLQEVRELEKKIERLSTELAAINSKLGMVTDLSSLRAEVRAKMSFSEFAKNYLGQIEGGLNVIKAKDFLNKGEQIKEETSKATKELIVKVFWAYLRQLDKLHYRPFSSKAEVYEDFLDGNPILENWLPNYGIRILGAGGQKPEVEVRTPSDKIDVYFSSEKPEPILIDFINLLFKLDQLAEGQEAYIQLDKFNSIFGHLITLIFVVGLGFGVLFLFPLWSIVKEHPFLAILAYVGVSVWVVFVWINQLVGRRSQEAKRSIREFVKNHKPLISRRAEVRGFSVSAAEEKDFTGGRVVRIRITKDDFSRLSRVVDTTVRNAAEFTRLMNRLNRSPKDPSVPSPKATEIDEEQIKIVYGKGEEVLVNLSDVTDLIQKLDTIFNPRAEVRAKSESEKLADRKLLIQPQIEKLNERLETLRKQRGSDSLQEVRELEKKIERLSTELAAINSKLGMVTDLSSLRAEVRSEGKGWGIKKGPQLIGDLIESYYKGLLAYAERRLAGAQKRLSELQSKEQVRPEKMDTATRKIREFQQAVTNFQTLLDNYVGRRAEVRSLPPSILEKVDKEVLAGFGSLQSFFKTSDEKWAKFLSERKEAMEKIRDDFLEQEKFTEARERLALIVRDLRQNTSVLAQEDLGLKPEYSKDAFITEWEAQISRIEELAREVLPLEAQKAYNDYYELAKPHLEPKFKDMTLEEAIRIYVEVVKTYGSPKSEGPEKSPGRFENDNILIVFQEISKWTDLLNNRLTPLIGYLDPGMEKLLGESEVEKLVNETGKPVYALHLTKTAVDSGEPETLQKIEGLWKRIKAESEKGPERAEVRLPAARLPDGQGKAGSLLPGRALLPKLRAETRFERGGVRVESGSFGPISEFEHGLAVPTVGTPNLPVIAPVVLPGLVSFFQNRDPRIAARVAVDLFRSADKPNPLMDVLLTEDPVLASAFLEVLKEMTDQGITREDQIYALVERVFSEKLREGALLRKSLETPAAHTVVLDHAPNEEEFLGILFPAILNRSLFIEILFTPGSGVDKQKMRELVKEARKLIRDSRRRLVVIHSSSQDWGLFRTTLSQTGQRLHHRMAGVSGVPKDLGDFIQRSLAVSLSEPLWGLSNAGELPLRTIVYKFTRGSEGYATKFGAVSILASKLGVLSEPQKRNYFAVQGRRHEVKEDALGEFVASIQTAFSGIHKILASA